eukprot:CAMPEP_0172389924 /NCGR_PEP_ID=MMETSP1061-20121228/6705_1 /TAXON_ID=37318 /ORGANISM="Pseudo-nitzschia pungens, Strain cf. pungens" /LENGTH=649 /DNA_ID=CAMNT_0013120179 /DNA_START=67 /DNA_END=2016 /DNA_ORIENTATION=-
MSSLSSSSSSSSSWPKSPSSGKDKPKPILPLSCQRAFVRCMSLQRTSRLLLFLFMACFMLLVPPTIYLVTSPYPYQYQYDIDTKLDRPHRLKGHHGKRKHRSSKQHRGGMMRMNDKHDQDVFPTEDVGKQRLHAKLQRLKGVAENETVEGKKNIEPANASDVDEPESELESDQELYDISSNDLLKGFAHRHTFPSLAPRVVQLTDQRHSFRFEVAPGSASSSSSSLALPEEGVRELRARYLELNRQNPKQHNPIEPIGKGDCKPIAPDWQLSYHPTCNQIHELSGGWQTVYRLPANLSSVVGKTASDPESSSSLLSFEEGAAIHDEAIAPDVHHREQTRLVNHGAFRHVWMVRDADGFTKRAMKTLRSLKPREKKFDLRNHDRHRRDAMSFEQLQGSPLVVDLYASCSSTAIFDYADRGDLLGIFEREGATSAGDDASSSPSSSTGDTSSGSGSGNGSGISDLHLLEIAYNVSLSVHHAHHMDTRGRPTMAHTDIKVDQFIYQDGYYKLSDFNRVRFLTWNNELDKQCGFTVGKNGGEYRAPEEYAYLEETEKVDVYSLGNVLYFLLVREEVWQRKHHKEIYNLVKGGQRPKIPDDIYNRDGVFERHMIRAMEHAWVHEPEQRATALQVANILKEGIDLLLRSKGATEQ